MVAVDARDSRMHQDAQLVGICSNASFSVLVSEKPDVPVPDMTAYSLEPNLTFFEHVEANGQCLEDKLCQGQYYAAKFVAHTVGDYTLKATLASGSADRLGEGLTVSVDSASSSTRSHR